MTPDTPKKLSAYELAKIRERDAAIAPIVASGAKIDWALIVAALDDRVRLLSHIAALEAERAPAAVDREALGWTAYLLIEWSATECAAASVREAWDRLMGTERRERYCRIGEALHAAGAASRQGEIDALRAELSRERLRADEMCATEGERARTCEQLHAEIARLTADLHAAREAYASVKVGRDLCGQLLWETRADLGLATPSDPIDWGDLSEESKERFRALGAGMFGAMRASHARHVARKYEAEVERLTAELARLEAERAETAKEIERLRGHLDLDSFATLNDCAEDGARLTRELAAARDCGQADVCANAPGCARHWEERNRELTVELTTARTSANAVIDALEARVRAFQRVTGDPDAETVTPEMVEARIAGLTAELAAERAKADRRWTDQDTAMREAARADGAREEREACAQLVRPCVYGAGHAAAIRARGPSK